MIKNCNCSVKNFCKIIYQLLIFLISQKARKNLQKNKINNSIIKNKNLQFYLLLLLIINNNNNIHYHFIII